MINNKQNRGSRESLEEQISFIRRSQQSLEARLEVIEELLAAQRHSLRQITILLDAQSKQDMGSKPVKNTPAIKNSAGIQGNQRHNNPPDALNGVQNKAEQNKEEPDFAPDLFQNPEHLQQLISYCRAQGFELLSYQKNPKNAAQGLDGSAVLRKLALLGMRQVLGQNPSLAHLERSPLSLFTQIRLKEPSGRIVTLDCFFVSASDGYWLQYSQPAQDAEWRTFAQNLGLDVQQFALLSKNNLSAQFITEKCQQIWGKLSL